MMHLLLLATVTGLAVVGFVRADEKLKRADLIKLDDPKLREAEVARLAECDGKKKFLMAWRFHRCPQQDGKADLRVLAAHYEHDFQRSPSFGSHYEVEAPEELFGKGPGVGGLLEPSLSLVSDHVLLVFGSDGKELRPFGGDNYINRGYLFDFNRDGILDRADYSNHGVDGAKDQDIQVFELKTIERDSKSLLQVIYNWHHERADEINEWGFTCYDEDGDGRVEIAFGPKAATTDAERRRFVFRWDDASKRYSAGEIPPHSHIRVVQPEDTLEQIAKAGGLGYPIEGKSRGGDDAPATPAGAPKKPYVFQSLKGASDADLLTFCNGKEHRDSFSGPEDAVATSLPPGFWDMSPKDAALAFAEANRTPTHRRSWKLAIDDRGGIAPPKSGWWLHDWNSSGCYSFSKHVFALRFGVAEPALLATDYNSQGVVGRNPLADQPGSTARLIPLSEKEACFLADTLFWLDRIRSHGLEDSQGMSAFGSSADGHGTLHLLADGSTPREVASDTVWAMRSISGNWREDYSPEICLNLAEHLLANALPAHLGERWKVAPEIDRRSLMTPVEKRLEPRLDTPARDLLGEVIARAFERHSKDPIPAPALAQLVDSIGQEAFLEHQSALERLKASLPPKGPEDKEFEALEKRFAGDHFGNKSDDPAKHPKDYERYLALGKKRDLDPGPVLRDRLDHALEQLRLAVSSKELLKAVRADGEHTRWALDRLRRDFPAIWKDYLIGEFQHAALDGRKNIFETLAAGSPQAAKDLLALLSPKERNDLLIDVADFQIDHDPAAAATLVPALLEIVRERKDDYIRRGQAMMLLGRSKLSPEQAATLIPLLLAELKDPQKGDYPGADTFAEAMDTLSRLPGAATHLDEISRATKAGFSGFETGIDSLLRLAGEAPDRQARLEAFVRPCLKQHNGMMNDVFLVALALDLRGLAPEIAAMASVGPAVPDGEGASSGGGDFKGPAGERYHAAREITALWNEPDPATRARLWIAMIVSSPYPYEASRDWDYIKRLRERAADAIRELPRETRNQVIETMISATPTLRYYSETTDWLRALAAN